MCCGINTLVWASLAPPASPQPLAHLERLQTQRLAHHHADAIEDLVRLALVHVRRRRHHHVLGVDADAVEGRRLVRAAVRLDGADGAAVRPLGALGLADGHRRLEDVRGDHRRDAAHADRLLRRVERLDRRLEVGVDHHLRRVALRHRRVVAQVLGGAEAAGHDERGEAVRVEVGERLDRAACDARRLDERIARRRLLVARRVVDDVVLLLVGREAHRRVAGARDVGERGGVIVDQHCLTSDPNIMAIGECALYEGRIFGLVAPGYRMAEVAASRLLGGDGAFNGADMSTKLKLLGVQVGSIGDAHGATAGSLSYTYRDPRKNTYLRLNVSADAKTVVGAVMVGDTERYDQVLQYFLNQLTLPEAPETLILPSGEGGPLLAADQLPMTAAICSCHNVTKGAVIDVMADGHLALGDIKAITKASSGCGGCAALLKTVVDDELTRLGVEVDQSICEHFKFTRQELFHLCQVNEIRSFEELLGSHGQGRGCDICKPAVASILASLHNEYVLKQPLVGLQDTNDHMLANIQKNGTYSVVPRIAGGEITPDKLIVLGQVAKKYDLYTKITGGQRIDLFGARVHELPLIWKELVDAGFETGHAYGKSLRTVKSCVGSTWCRYGVQDSVAMALFLENRYKGLRSPHKLKFAVSGCTRECAEAQSKDVGVIATEGGWNLFVGGNGGMRPRHAELFATDLDDETLVRYIDRFLMFYVRSADRLQRTSVWVESLEGGLGYLQEVVIEDSLGLAVELENQMLRVVDTYQCEWKTTIEDPEQLKRFQTYVNSDAADSDVIFVRERGQRRPITEDERRVPLTELIENAG